LEEAGLDEREIIGIPPVEERAQRDPIVRGPRLLAEGGDPIRAHRAVGYQLGEQAMPDHAVADDDQTLSAIGQGRCSRRSRSNTSLFFQPIAAIVNTSSATFFDRCSDRSAELMLVMITKTIRYNRSTSIIAGALRRSIAA